MKKILTTTLVSIAFSCTLAFAHHAAEDAVDDEIYDQIDALLEDSEHADMSLDDLASGATTLTIEIDDDETYDQLVEDGLLQLINDLEPNTILIQTSDESDTTITVRISGTVENTEDNYAGEGRGSWDDEMN
jgi:hypothetical protein